MRKWMADRLKRRKKPADGTTKEASKAPAPEPLQPRFYDDEPGAAPAAPIAAKPIEIVDTVSAERSGSSHADASSSAEPVGATASVPAGSAARPRIARRRRGRGGRGGNRGRAGNVAPAVAAEASGAVDAATPAAAVGATEGLPAEAAPAQASAAARPSKGTVVLAIGLPGSGKSSWFKRHDIHPLSSDLLRELLFDDAQEQRFQDLVFSNLRSMLKARLIARRPLNYVDATNLTPHDRSSWIKLAKDYGYDVQGLFFDVPVEVCMERHQRRGRVVPEDIMRKMAGKLKAPTFDEGFSKITVVRVKQKEAAAG